MIYSCIQIIALQFSSVHFIRFLCFMHFLDVICSPNQLHPLHSGPFHVRSKTLKHIKIAGLFLQEFSATLFMPACNVRLTIGPHPKIGQLQAARFELLWKEPLLHHLSCTGLCWPLASTRNRTTSRCLF